MNLTRTILLLSLFIFSRSAYGQISPAAFERAWATQAA
jgi:hypothetical protein